MKKYKTLNLAKYGPVIDRDGDWAETLTNLERALADLAEKGYLQKTAKERKKLKVSILESRVNHRNENNPFRYEVTVVRNIDYLLKEWKRWNCNHGKNFDLAKYSEKKRWEMESHEREAQRRSGWGAYMQIRNFQKGIQEERDHREKVSRMSSSEREKADNKREEELSKKPRLLYIG